MDEQKEIEDAMVQSSAGLLLRIWEEVFLLVLEYLRKTETSPFKKMTAIFARKEYQKDKGNLSHSHLMIRLNWSLMSDIETEFVNDLIRASICDIVRPDEVEKFVEEGVFTNVHDIHQVYEHAATYLPHRCNDR